MKTSHYLQLLIVILFTLIALSCGTTRSLAEKSEQEKILKETIERREYTFNAERVNPTSMSSRSLTPGYTFKVSIDKIISYLPFFGKTYKAPFAPDENGIKFECNDYQYDAINDSKKGKWNINIKCKLTSKIVEMRLEIWNNGRASLSVNDSDKESISYIGYIE